MIEALKTILGKMHHLIAERRCRVIFQVNDNRQMADLTRAVERLRCRCR
ncbi:hypothetical protein QU906_14335 [Escherichia coli]|nr:hypothetical protein [Escherichia coli]